MTLIRNNYKTCSLYFYRILKIISAFCKSQNYLRSKLNIEKELNSYNNDNEKTKLFKKLLLEEGYKFKDENNVIKGYRQKVIVICERDNFKRNEATYIYFLPDFYYKARRMKKFSLSFD